MKPPSVSLIEAALSEWRGFAAVDDVRIERVAGRKVDGVALDRHAEDGPVLLLVRCHHFGSRFVSLGVGLNAPVTRKPPLPSGSQQNLNLCTTE